MVSRWTMFLTQHALENLYCHIGILTPNMKILAIHRAAKLLSDTCFERSYVMHCHLNGDAVHERHSITIINFYVDAKLNTFSPCCLNLNGHLKRSTRSLGIIIDAVRTKAKVDK